MSRSISSIPTSELSDLNFVDLDEQEMLTLAGGQALVIVNAENVLKEGVNVNAENALKEGVLKEGIKIG